ncbi:MAG TPA: hypothetical protein VIW22_06300 [Nitrososphaerales archaeon]
MSRQNGLWGLSFGSIEVIMLITLQVTATSVLWLLNPINQGQTETFALYLSADLLAFSILSYRYRSQRSVRPPSTLWISIGYLAMVAILTSNLFLR